jgi:hypothetical protein
MDGGLMVNSQEMETGPAPPYPRGSRLRPDPREAGRRSFFASRTIDSPSLMPQRDRVRPAADLADTKGCARRHRRASRCCVGRLQRGHAREAAADLIKILLEVVYGE